MAPRTRSARRNIGPLAEAPRPPGTETASSQRTRLEFWAHYQRLLKEKPHKMQLGQACMLALLGNVCNQCLLSSATHRFDVALVLEQVSVNVLVSPATICWFSVLQRLKLHWVVASLADQCVFNVILNVCVFYFLAAFFRGGLSIEQGFAINRHVFPSLMSYKPVWELRAKGFVLKLPTTLLRERLVPKHFKGIYELGVRLVWAVIVAAQLAAWTSR